MWGRQSWRRAGFQAGFSSRGTRPRVEMRLLSKPGNDRVPFYIPHDSFEFSLADPVIVRLSLPESLPRAIEHSVGFSRGVPFQRLHDRGNGSRRADQDMNVVGHDYVRMQHVATQFILGVAQS